MFIIKPPDSSYCRFNLHYLAQILAWEKKVLIFSLVSVFLSIRSCLFFFVCLLRVFFKSMTNLYILLIVVSLMLSVRNLKVISSWICSWNPWHDDSMHKVFPLSFLHDVTAFLILFFLCLVHLLLTECWFLFCVTCMPLSPQCSCLCTRLFLRSVQVSTVC